MVKQISEVSNIQLVLKLTEYAGITRITLIVSSFSAKRGKTSNINVFF